MLTIEIIKEGVKILSKSKVKIQNYISDVVFIIKNGFHILF